MMRFDVEFFGGVLVGLIIALLLVVGFGIGQARADCTGCSDVGPAREASCLSWWTLPDGERMCVRQPWEARRAKATPDIIAPEPDLCIFASDVRNGLYRWRACEAVK